MADASVLCPSARCKPGATLLGLVMEEGRVEFFQDRVEIDEEFVRIAGEGRSPERRFRFSSSCVKGACSQWTGTRCGVIDELMVEVGPVAGAEIPVCSIRSQCRWFQQSGMAACAICPSAITDLRPEWAAEPVMG